MSGSSDVFVVANSYPGVEVLHCTMEVFFSGRCDDVVMVCHEHYVMNEKVIFFMGFLQCLEEYADNLSLIEPEGSVVCSAYQMVWEYVLYDSKWPSHGVTGAKMLPISIIGMKKDIKRNKVL